MQFMKYNKVLVKPGKRDESIEAILAFFKVVQSKDTQMKGFIVMTSLEDLLKLLSLLFGKLKRIWMSSIRKIIAFYQI